MQIYQGCIVAARTLAAAILLIGLARYFGFAHFPADHELWANSAVATLAFFAYALFVLLPISHLGRSDFTLTVVTGALIGVGSFWIMFQWVLQPVGAHYLWPMRWSVVNGLFVTLYYSYIPSQVLLRRQRRLPSRKGGVDLDA